MKEGTDPKYGARHLKRAIERHLVFPLSGLISTEQIRAGDKVNVDVASTGDGLVFKKEEVVSPELRDTGVGVPPLFDPTYNHLTHACAVFSKTAVR